MRVGLLPALLVLTGFTGCGERAATPPASAPARFGTAERQTVGAALLSPEAQNSTLVAVDAGIAGDRVSGLLEIPPTECAVVVARAGSTIEDVDLFAYGEDGSVVATDEAPDKTPALLICPPHPRRVWLTARIASGHGLVAVAAERVHPRDAESRAARYAVKTSLTPSQRLSAWPGLEERIEEHRTDLGAAWQDVRRVALPLDARMPTRISTEVEAGRCVDAFVVPSDEIGHLELHALDVNGAIIGRAERMGRERYLVVCSGAQASLAFEVRPQSGRGLGLMLLSRTRPGTEEELDTAITRLEAFPFGDLESELRQAADTLAKSGDAPARAIATGTLEVARRLSLPLTLPAGCSRLQLVGGAPLRGIEAWVWSPNGSLVSHAKSAGHAALFACGPSGSARLDLEATLRSGPFSVLQRNEPDAHPALSSNPLAASRLLARLVDRGMVQKTSEVGAIKELDLAEGTLSTLDLVVPFGRCVDITLALGTDTLGAEIRLVSVSSGKQVALARHPHTASTRVCALTAESARDTLNTRAELQVRVGRGKGLVVTRLLSPTR